MSSVQKMQKVDRELFLELIESPINPAFLHISTPLTHCDPMFYLQINGEALWQCRAIKKLEQMFQVLQDNLLHWTWIQIIFPLQISCRDPRLWQGELSNQKGSKPHQQQKPPCSAIKLLVYDCPQPRSDIAQGPDEIIASLKETEQELVRENQKLTKELEGKNNKRQMQLLSMYLSKAGLSYFTKHNYLLGFGKANYLYTIVLYYLIFLQRKHQSCTKLWCSWKNPRTKVGIRGKQSTKSAVDNNSATSKT